MSRRWTWARNAARPPPERRDQAKGKARRGASWRAWAVALDAAWRQCLQDPGRHLPRGAAGHGRVGLRSRSPVRGPVRTVTRGPHGPDRGAGGRPGERRRRGHPAWRRGLGAHERPVPSRAPGRRCRPGGRARHLLTRKGCCPCPVQVFTGLICPAAGVSIGTLPALAAWPTMKKARHAAGPLTIASGISLTAWPGSATARPCSSTNLPFRSCRHGGHDRNRFPRGRSCRAGTGRAGTA